MGARISGVRPKLKLVKADRMPVLTARYFRCHIPGYLTTCQIPGYFTENTRVFFNTPVI